MDIFGNNFYFSDTTNDRTMNHQGIKLNMMSKVLFIHQVHFDF